MREPGSPDEKTGATVGCSEPAGSHNRIGRGWWAWQEVRQPFSLLHLNYDRGQLFQPNQCMRAVAGKLQWIE